MMDVALAIGRATFMAGDMCWHVVRFQVGNRGEEDQPDEVPLVDEDVNPNGVRLLREYCGWYRISDLALQVWMATANVRGMLCC